jgi:hypothetical protein
MYPPESVETTYLYSGGRVGIKFDGDTVMPPDRMLYMFAFERFAPARNVDEISVFVKFASLKFTLGPIIYPPLTLLKISRYVVGENTIGCIGESISAVGAVRTKSLPDFVFVKFTFVKFTPSTYTNDMSLFKKFAPLKSILGPIIYPPLTELCIYR